MMENVLPHIVRQVGRELASLQSEPPEGIRVHVNEENIADIQATIAGPPDTPYTGGCFKVKLVLGKDFPASPPKAFFLTKIFHPNVAPSNGEICVNTLKKEWKSEFGLKHVLLTIKCLLIVPNAESALNEEAGKLLLEAYDEYSARAKLFTDLYAKPPQTKKTLPSEVLQGPAAKRPAEDRKIAKKKKDNRKGLKRL